MSGAIEFRLNGRAVRVDSVSPNLTLLGSSLAVTAGSFFLSLFLYSFTSLLHFFTSLSQKVRYFP